MTLLNPTSAFAALCSVQAGQASQLHEPLCFTHVFGRSRSWIYTGGPLFRVKRLETQGLLLGLSDIDGLKKLT